MKRKLLIAVIAVLLLFIITNPGISSFKAFVGSSSYAGLHRIDQFFVCSVYEHRDEKYFGIFGNFWLVNPPRSSIVHPVQMGADTFKNPDNQQIVGKTSDGLPIFKKK